MLPDVCMFCAFFLLNKRFGGDYFFIVFRSGSFDLFADIENGRNRFGCFGSYYQCYNVCGCCMVCDTCI